MLEKTTTTTILDFVRQQPRTIQEIAFHLKKNWRTADRYVNTIATESGLLATRTFRAGTRGALKVVFWNALDRAKGSAHQERLLQSILHSKRKEDFSPFDIYQFITPEKREAFLEETEFSQHPKIAYDTLLSQAHQQLLFFSGNLSWVELGPRMMHVLETLAKKKVQIKVLTRIDITSQKNTEAFLALNQRVGWDAIQIRHCEQPLRAVIVDDRLISIKEVLSPTYYRELKNKTFLFYLLHDPEWIRWMQKVFWHLWEQSVDGETRLDSLHSLQKLNKK